MRERGEGSRGAEGEAAEYRQIISIEHDKPSMTVPAPQTLKFNHRHLYSVLPYRTFHPPPPQGSSCSYCSYCSLAEECRFDVSASRTPSIGSDDPWLTSFGGFSFFFFGAVFFATTYIRTGTFVSAIPYHTVRT